MRAVPELIMLAAHLTHPSPGNVDEPILCFFRRHKWDVRSAELESLSQCGGGSLFLTSLICRLEELDLRT